MTLPFFVLLSLFSALRFSDGRKDGQRRASGDDDVDEGGVRWIVRARTPRIETQEGKRKRKRVEGCSRRRKGSGKVS